MSNPKTTIKKGKTIHYASGAIIKKGNKFLMIKRGLPPPGYAFIAGHVEKNETPSKALAREVKEEVNLKVISKKFLLKKFITQKQNCVLGTKHHYYYVYDCKVSGKIKPDIVEVKKIKFLSKGEIKKLYKQDKLEYAWKILLKELKIV